ncbi:hypothetical protein D3C72_2540840 [compost metagenome]
MQFSDAGTVRRMGGKEFRRLAFAGFGHFLPECDRGIGVVAGTSRKFQTHDIGFGFMLAAIG